MKSKILCFLLAITMLFNSINIEAFASDISQVDVSEAESNEEIVIETEDVEESEDSEEDSESEEVIEESNEETIKNEDSFNSEEQNIDDKEEAIEEIDNIIQEYSDGNNLETEKMETLFSLNDFDYFDFESGKTYLLKNTTKRNVNLKVFDEDNKEQNSLIDTAYVDYSEDFYANDFGYNCSRCVAPKAKKIIENLGEKKRIYYSKSSLEISECETNALTYIVLKPGESIYLINESNNDDYSFEYKESVSDKAKISYAIYPNEISNYNKKRDIFQYNVYDSTSKKIQAGFTKHITNTDSVDYRIYYPTVNIVNVNLKICRTDYEAVEIIKIHSGEGFEVNNNGINRLNICVNDTSNIKKCTYANYNQFGYCNEFGYGIGEDIPEGYTKVINYFDDEELIFLYPHFFESIGFCINSTDENALDFYSLLPGEYLWIQDLQNFGKNTRSFIKYKNRLQKGTIIRKGKKVNVPVESLICTDKEEIWNETELQVDGVTKISSASNNLQNIEIMLPGRYAKTGLFDITHGTNSVVKGVYDKSIPENKHWIVLLNDRLETISRSDLEKLSFKINKFKQVENYDSSNNVFRIVEIEKDLYALEVPCSKKLEITISVKTEDIDEKIEHVISKKENLGGQASSIIVPLFDIPVISSVKLDDFEEDISINECYIYKSHNKKNKIKVEVAKNGFDSYELREDSRNNNDKLLASSDDGEFDVNLAQELLPNGKEYYEPLLYIASFIDGVEVSRTYIHIGIFEKAPSFSDCSVTLEEGFSFTVDEDIPIIGNQTIKFNVLEDLPAKVEVSDDGNKIQLYLGAMKKMKEENDDNNQDYIQELINSNEKMVLALKEAISKDKGITKSVLNTSANCTFGAYVELPYDINFDESQDNLKVDIIETNMILMLKIEGSVDKTWNVLVGYVPVYVYLEIGASGEVNFKIGYCYDKEESKVGADCSMATKATLSAGLGVHNALSVGPTGTFGLEYKLDSLENERFRVMFGIEDLGIKASFWIFESSLKIDDQEWQLYPRQKKGRTYFTKEQIYDENNFKVRTYNYFLDDGRIAQAYNRKSSDNNVLINGIFPDARPKYISFNGVDYLFYIDAQRERIAENTTALCYKMNCGNGWSEAIVVSDDGTADFMYDVVSTSDGIYAVWQNAESSLEGVNQLMNAVEKINISVALISGEKCKTVNLPETVKKSHALDFAITEYNDEIHICWFENSENNILNNHNGRNFIKTYAIGDKKESIIAEVDDAILTIDYGVLNNELHALCTIDIDGRMDTLEDREICLYTKAGRKLVTNNQVLDSNAQFVKYEGKDGFVFYQDGIIKFSDDGKTFSDVMSDDVRILTDNFQFASNGNAAVILWPSTYSNVEKTGHAIYMSKYINGKWTVPNNVCSVEDSLTSYCVKVEEDCNAQLFYTTRGEYEGQEINRLYSEKAKEVSSASISYLDCIESSYVENEPFEIRVVMKNDGNCEIDDCQILIINKTGDVIYSKNVDKTPIPGEYASIALDNVFFDDTGDIADYQVKLICDGNVCGVDTLSIGAASFDLNYLYKYEEMNKMLCLQIMNHANFPGDVKLQFISTETNKVLSEEKISNIQGNSSYHLKYPVEEIWKMTDEEGIRVVITSLGRTEKYTNFNYFTIINSERREKDTSITINKNEIQLNVGEVEQLNAIVSSEKIDDYTVRWESSNPEVATVDSYGQIDALKEGFTTIVASTIDGKTASCVVEVIDEQEEIIYHITYFDGENMITCKPDTYTAKDNIKLVNPYKKGYEFVGWHKQEDLSDVSIVEIPKNSKENLILYAEWKKLEVKIPNEDKGSNQNTSNTIPNEKIEDNRKDEDINITKCSFTAEFAGNSAFQFDDSEIKPQVVVRDGNKVLTEGVDYEIYYANNIQAATLDSTVANCNFAPLVDKKMAPVVIIRGKGSYASYEMINLYFTIYSLVNNDDQQILEEIIKEHGTGSSEQMKDVDIVDEDVAKEMKLSSDIFSSLSDEQKTDKKVASSIVSSESENQAFVATKNLKKAKVKLKDTIWKCYTGEGIYPEVESVKLNNASIPFDISNGYIVSYGENTKVGFGTVTIEGKGEYFGSKTVRFVILPKWLQWLLNLFRIS